MNNFTKQPSESQSGFDYYAFISYKRKDERWAQWLQKQLEGYYIPSAIRKEIPRIPKHVRPVFRDKTDLGAGGLTTSLHAELERSKYLIVICSPHSAQSEWVGKEIEHFRQLGREKDVIPFIVNGIPHSGNSQTECFNPVFDRFEDEPLGINVQEIGRNQALVKVLAKMLDIRFDRLWDRHKRIQQKKKIMSVAACGLAAVLGLLYWEYTRPMFEYYSDYVDKWGIPEGVVPLNKQQVKHRRDMYRFEYRRVPLGHYGSLSWRLTKVAYVNSAGTVIEHGNTEKMDRTSIVEVEYGRKSGDVTQINQCNRSGKVMMRSKISSRNGEPASLVDLQGSTDSDASGYLGASTSSMSSQIFSAENGRTSIKRYVLTRDADGHITRRTYHANNDDNIQNSAVSDADGIFGMEYSLDSLGRVLEIAYLGCDYTPTVTKKCITGKKYKYDEHGVLSKTIYCGENGILVLNEQLWAQCEIITDENGNIVEEICLDTQGLPCLNSDGYAKCTAKYDDKGNPIEVSFFGTDGQPCLGSDGYAKWIAKYDDRGNEIERAFFGTNGQPCFVSDGFAQWIAKYDDRGNQIECSYFGTDGQPCLNSGGQAKWIVKYDDKGNPIEVSFFGTDGQPCLGSNGFAKWIAKYDDRGNEIERTFFGTNGQPCFVSDGFAQWIAKYDDRGNQIECSYFGTDGQPCLGSDGYAKWIAKYDYKGNMIECSYYGVDQSLCISKVGCAILRKQYDERGKLIIESYYGVDGNLCCMTKGYARTEMSYDARGNLVKQSFFGIDGYPAYNMDIECSSYKSHYDSRGNLIERSYYGPDGECCVNINGVATFKVCVDERGNRIEETHYGVNGQPCLDNFGFHKITRDINDRGYLLQESYYGIDGNIRLAFKAKYDERGNKIEVAYYGCDGLPDTNNKGVSIYRTSYDERGNNVETTCYDVNGNPCLDSNNCFKMTRVFDERGHLLQESYWGVDNKPCIIKNGMASCKFKFDNYGHKIEESYYGTDGKPCRYFPGNISCWKAKFDEMGREDEYSNYDENGNPTDCDNGYYKITRDYADGEIPISESYYNAKGILINKHYYVFRIKELNKKALSQEMLNAIIIKWNEWDLTNSINYFENVKSSSDNSRRIIYMLNPQGEILQFCINGNERLGAKLTLDTVDEETYHTAVAQLP